MVLMSIVYKRALFLFIFNKVLHYILFVSTISLLNRNTKKRKNKMLNINQIVKGKKAGTFIVLGFRKISGVMYAQVKSVNPNNHNQTSPGEFALPLTALEII
mgnify:CR=1 FL=1|tara:strand:- start:581 stop:886 length:306 start_codon:yes stop_codon:yes gene_type:complete